MKSMAYSLTFQNPEDSLTDEEVARYMEKFKLPSKKKSTQKCAKSKNMKQLRISQLFFLQDLQVIGLKTL